MGYFIYFVWKFVTETLKPSLGKNKELIRLLDQIRMLDNDLIRLQSKLTLSWNIDNGKRFLKIRRERETLKEKEKNEKS